MEFEIVVLVAWVGICWVNDIDAIATLEGKEMCEVGRVETVVLTSLT